MFKLYFKFYDSVPLVIAQSVIFFLRNFYDSLLNALMQFFLYQRPLNQVTRYDTKFRAHSAIISIKI